MRKFLPFSKKISFLVVSLVLISVSCRKDEQSPLFSQHPAYEIYRSCLYENGGAFKDGNMTIKSGGGSEITGVLA